MRICFVSRELYPCAGGGIAPIVAAAAAQLSEIAEVVVVTSATARDRLEELRAAGDPRVLPETVEVLFAPEPEDEDKGGFLHYMHRYSAGVHRILREHYRDRGPDVLEFCDYLGEGLVTIQARVTCAPWLAQTLVCVRVHTTSELCAVLDGYVPDEFEVEALFDSERYCLRHADRVLTSGGDVLDTYHRYYGTSQVANAVEIPDAFLDESVGAPGSRDGGPLGHGHPVRLLYLGRAERRKGIQDLLAALLESGRHDWRLTLVGGDTDTGPLGTSLGAQLRLLAAEDPRVDFRDAMPRPAIGALIREHDVVVVPSRWECWPNVAREALQHNRPILATPVGGLVAMVRPGVSGWLATGTTRREIGTAISALLDDPDQITELIAAGGPRSVFDELTDVDALRQRYRRLADETAQLPPRPDRDADPLVSVVVPYFHMDAFVEQTLDAVAAQTYDNIETIVVNDGSFRPEDLEVLARVASRPGVRVVSQANAGLGAARNFGVSQAAGKYVLPLDSDDLIVPEFVGRLVEVLERRSELAYVGTWVQYVDEDGVPFGGDSDGYMPLGNSVGLIHRSNVGGVCTSLFRRAVFQSGLRYDEELTSYEDWMLLREMHDRRLVGAIVPERLFHYRIRTASMTRQVARPRLARLEGELRARRLEYGTRWTASAIGVDRSAPSEHHVELPAPPAPDDQGDRLLASNAQLASAIGRRGAAAGAALAGLEEARARVTELEAETARLRTELARARRLAGTT
ncbi:glycosyltransferase [Conexibacter sp. W3-3-2]|uniref:glycosyltransferase n=1 Tax=Conexibacter sp. W3-3-2 TaxID=2675227 RepID=UPI0012B7B66B|nr:glycosyltransferase [Conexibacter sp. W3-3-2]MTD46238.1 glycosyltransferase [Conexibacter sp. W3-3-2]